MKKKKPVKKPQPSSSSQPAAAPVARVMWAANINSIPLSLEEESWEAQFLMGNAIDKPSEVLVIDLSRREGVEEVMAVAIAEGYRRSAMPVSWSKAALKALEQLARRGKK